MTHIQNLETLYLQQPSVITIGVFDGVHKGHQYLVRRLVETAHADDLLAVVLTFFPHPDQVVQGIQGRYYLTTAEQRAAYLLDLGVDYVITHPFDDNVRHMRAARFVDQLVAHLRPKKLWVGADFALGYKREGNVEFLTQQGRNKGFSVHTIDLLQTENSHATITSSLIREALFRGEVEQARDWLGRAYQVSGEVVHGEKRGRTIGFPTANIEVWKQQVIPANGVYAGWAYLGTESLMAVTNIGVRPTFNKSDVTVEAHLLDFDRDIYGEILTISFETYLRPEVKFNNPQALISQINADVEKGREYLLVRSDPEKRIVTGYNPHT
jgi:riboflavin kinase/FMN adenylyltransferase